MGQARLDRRVMPVRAQLHPQLLLRLRGATRQVVESVLHAAELRQLPLLGLLCAGMLEPSLLLQGLHLLLKLLVPLPLGLEAARPRAEALVEALDSARQGLALVQQSPHAALDLRPAHRALALARAVASAQGLLQARLHAPLE